MKAIRASDELIQDIIDGNAEEVAKGVEICHEDNTSILQYNNENSLSCVISLAFYAARKNYSIIRELPTGKGFADIVLLPFKYSDNPAIVIELKRDKSALSGYADEIILVGISYDDSKGHSCIIEKVRL